MIIIDCIAFLRRDGSKFAYVFSRVFDLRLPHIWAVPPPKQNQLNPVKFTKIIPQLHW